MKEFFQWYMVASIVGAWALMAYAFYRLSRIAEDIEDIRELMMSKVNVRSYEIEIVAIDKRLDNHSEILSERVNEANCIRNDVCMLTSQVLELSKAISPDNFLAARWVGKNVVVHTKNGSYFCVLKSINMDEESCSAKVEDAYLVDLGRGKTLDNKLIKNCSISIITVSRVYGGKEFAIKDIINIDTSKDVIEKMTRLIKDTNS